MLWVVLPIDMSGLPVLVFRHFDRGQEKTSPRPGESPMTLLHNTFGTTSRIRVGYRPATPVRMTREEALARLKQRTMPLPGRVAPHSQPGVICATPAVPVSGYGRSCRHRRGNRLPRAQTVAARDRGTAGVAAPGFQVGGGPLAVHLTGYRQHPSGPDPGQVQRGRSDCPDQSRTRGPCDPGWDRFDR